MNYTYTHADHAARNAAEHFDRALIAGILAHYKPASLLDLGCGVGWYCDFARRQGVPCVVGMDSTPKIQSIALCPVVEQDVAADLQLWEPNHDTRTPRMFDVLLCLEVAQYLAADKVRHLVDNCARHGKVIVWSAAHPGQKCPHGQTFNTPGYYADMFAARGFNCRPVHEWRDIATLPWFKRNLIVLETR